MTSLLARNDSKTGTTMTPISARRLGPKKITPEDVAIGMRVRSLRNERKMSQTALADALSLTFQQIQKYELGRNRMSGSRIAEVAAIFGVPPATLIGTSEARLEQSLGDRMTASTRGCKVAVAFPKLDREAQDMIVNLAEWLLLMQEKGK